MIAIAQRITFVYPNGKSTYGTLVDGDDPYFEFLNQRYEIKDIAATGAVVAANNPETLRRMNELGMPCRPTSRQHVISISVQEETKRRLKAGAEKTGRSVSNILETCALKWLDENGIE